MRLWLSNVFRAKPFIQTMTIKSVLQYIMRFLCVSLMYTIIWYRFRYVVCDRMMEWRGKKKLLPILCIDSKWVRADTRFTFVWSNVMALKDFHSLILNQRWEVIKYNTFSYKHTFQKHCIKTLKMRWTFLFSIQMFFNLFSWASHTQKKVYENKNNRWSTFRDGWKWRRQIFFSSGGLGSTYALLSSFSCKFTIVFNIFLIIIMI